MVVLPDPETPIRMMITACSSCITLAVTEGKHMRIVEDSGGNGGVGSLRHVHKNAQNLSRIVNVVLFQIDVDCIADELEKFPDTARCDGPIHRRNGLVFLSLKHARRQHGGDTLP